MENNNKKIDFRELKFGMEWIGATQDKDESWG